jgi:hypothetical protein
MKAVTGQLLLDGDVASVAEFIEREIPADRRLYVAQRLPEIALVIWADTRCALLSTVPSRETRPNASEYAPVEGCAGDGSAAVMGGD